MILLDSCVLIWLAADQSQISALAKAELEKRVFISAISAFEIGQKAAAGKLKLPSPIDIWFPAIIKQHMLEETPPSSAAAARATRLPSIHADPFDRLIIATAMELNLTILTPDTRIRSYPGVRAVW